MKTGHWNALSLGTKRRVLFCTTIGVGYIVLSQTLRTRLFTITELRVCWFATISLTEIVLNSTRRISNKILCRSDRSSFPMLLIGDSFPVFIIACWKDLFLILMFCMRNWPLRKQKTRSGDGSFCNERKISVYSHPTIVDTKSDAHIALWLIGLEREWLQHVTWSHPENSTCLMSHFFVRKIRKIP